MVTPRATEWPDKAVHWPIRLIAVLTFIGHGYLCAAQDAGYTAYKDVRLGSLQGDFQRISQSHGKDPTFKRFKDRLALIDELANILASRFRTVGNQALKELLTDVVGPQARPALDKPGSAPLSARELYMEHRDRFLIALPMPRVTQDEARLLRDYYQASIRAAEGYIMDRWKLPLGLDKQEAGEAQRLYLVLPFLRIPDEAWSDRDVDGLPEQLKETAVLETFEWFSLCVNRPFTGAAFARYGRKEPWSRKQICNYLMQSAERLRRNSEYHPALHCLKTAKSVADSVDADTGMKVYCELAELYEWLGHPKKAAATAADALEAFPESSDRGRAAVIRLKCLYRADEHLQILREAPQYQADDSCRAYLAEIIYISWVTHRRQGKSKVAQALQKEFMAKYPKNPLCADMCFASALTALASGDDDKAAELLDLIETRYPNSRAVARARKVKQEMSKDWGQAKD